MLDQSQAVTSKGITLFYFNDHTSGCSVVVGSVVVQSGVVGLVVSVVVVVPPGVVGSVVTVVVVVPPVVVGSVVTLVST